MQKFSNIASSTIKATASADLTIDKDLANINDKKLEDLFNEKKESAKNKEENKTQSNKEIPQNNQT